MKTSRSRIADIIVERLGSISSKELSREVAAYLLSEGRVSELEPLLRDVMQKRAENGSVEVTAVSAHPLTNSIRDEISAEVRKLYPNAKEVIIIEQHDESVVGGVKIELANQQLDLSIRGKLNKFKQLTA